MLRLFNYSPPGYCEDSAERSKHKLCFNVCLSLFLTMIFVVLLNYTFGFSQIMYLQWIVLGIFAGLTFLYKYHKTSRVLTTSILLGSGVVFLSIVVVITNIIRSPILPWFCVIPLFAFWLLDGRHAKFWLLVCCLSYLLFLYLSLTGYQPSSVYDYYLGQNKFYAVFGQILLLLNVYIVGYDFEKKKKSAIDEINQANAELKITLNKLQLAKEELEEAQKHKDVFIAQMSHEMRTPMNAICGVSELLVSRNIEKDLTSILANSSNQLLNIINDILDISKLQTGKFQIQNIPYLLDELIQDVYSYTRKSCDEKNIKLHFSITSIENVQLIGDPYRLRQILHNILSNAVKFTERGFIAFDVNLDESNSNIYFKVSDTGIGMTEEELVKVFIPFSQANNSIHLKYGGTGIGLNITKQLAELFGGTIRINSTYGQGTEVSIKFPVTFSKGDADLVMPEKNIVSDEMKHSLKDIKILLAEDNEVNRIIFTELIKSEIPEISINTATNGEEVMDKLENESYDLVIMDIQMPRMDGLQTTRIIRKHSAEKIRDITIIALSAYARKVEIEECINAGMNGYLPKPINKNDLLYKVYKLLVTKKLLEPEQSQV